MNNKYNPEMIRKVEGQVLVKTKIKDYLGKILEDSVTTEGFGIYANGNHEYIKSGDFEKLLFPAPKPKCASCPTREGWGWTSKRKKHLTRIYIPYLR